MFPVEVSGFFDPLRNNPFQFLPQSKADGDERGAFHEVPRTHWPCFACGSAWKCWASDWHALLCSELPICSCRWVYRPLLCVCVYVAIVSRKCCLTHIKCHCDDCLACGVVHSSGLAARQFWTPTSCLTTTAQPSMKFWKTRPGSTSSCPSLFGKSWMTSRSPSAQSQVLLVPPSLEWTLQTESWIHPFSSSIAPYSND